MVSCEWQNFGWVDFLAYIYSVLVLLKLEQIPLPLMYDWYWILFFNAGCFCSALTPGEIGCLDFYSSKCGGEFSKQMMGAEAGFWANFDWVSFCVFV